MCINLTSKVIDENGLTLFNGSVLLIDNNNLMSDTWKSYIKVLEEYSKDKYGVDYISVLSNKSGFKENTLKRIFGLKYPMKINDFVELSNSIGLSIFMKNELGENVYPDLSGEENFLPDTDDTGPIYKSKND